MQEKRKKESSTSNKRSKRSKRLAQEHWRFLESWLSLVFEDSFVHGYKHGVENEKKKAKARMS